MANEARVFAEGPENCIVRYFTVADATAIAKGAMLCENGDRTGLAHVGGGYASPLGYTTNSKEASDGFVEIGCQRTGVVLAYCDGAARTGQMAVLGSTANRVRALVDADISKYQDLQAVVGRFIGTGSNGATVKVALTLG